MERLRRLVDASAKGEGAVVTIAGDHGVGKTRLAREAAALAERAGTLVLWGRGYDDEGSPAYWPWAEVVTRCLESTGVAHARKLMGEGARDIAGMIPALRSLSPDPREEGAPPSAEARYRLFGSMRGFLRRAAAETPLLIVLDDLHYCDRDTLRLLEAVCADLNDCGVVLVGTYVEQRVRRNAHVTSLLASLVKLPWHHRLRLGNLSCEDVRCLLALQTGRRTALQLAPRVHALTEGNALYVVETARQLATARRNRQASADAWEKDAEGAIDTLVRERLARLSAGAREFLETAAVLGRGFELRAVAAALHLDLERAGALLLEAVEEGGVEQLAPDGCRFAHELVQRSITAALRPDQVSRLHRAAGEALEALRAQGEAVETARLAWHFRAAGSQALRKAAHYAQEAGLEALEACAYDTALRCFREAEWPRLGAAERADLALLQAQTLFALGRFREVTAALSRAFEGFAATGNTERAVETAEFGWYPEGGRWLPRDELRRLRERALAMVDPESREAARLLCELGESHAYATYPAADACLTRARLIAERLGDRHLAARIWYNRAWLERLHLHHPADIESAERGLAAIADIGDRNLELMLGGLLGQWKLTDGDTKGARELLNKLRAGGDEARSTMWNTHFVRFARTLIGWTGRWDEVESTAKVRRWLGWTLRKVVVQKLNPLRIRLITGSGVLAHYRAHPDQFLNPDAVARTALEASDFARATGERAPLPRISALADQALAMELSPRGRLDALAALGYVASLRSDLATLSRAWEPGLTTPYNCLVTGLVLDRLRGLFASLLGLVREAAAYFESALAFAREAESVWEVPWSCLDYSAFLLRHGELSGARELAEEARLTGTNLGMPGFEREVQEVIARLDGILPDGLGPREVDVIRLVAAGLASKEIAAELAISYHTVVNHLGSIYRKTRTRGRVELARYALRKHIAATPERPGQ